MTGSRLSVVILRLATVALALVLACSAPSGGGPGPGATRTAAPTPFAGMGDDMMGGALSELALVLDGDELLAIRLLDHFVSLRVAVGEDPQAAASPDGRWAYVVDQVRGDLRLRSYDLASGTMLTQLVEPTAGWSPARPRLGRGAISVAPDGRVLVLRSDGFVRQPFAYESVTLRALGRTLPATMGPGCVDETLLVSSSRTVLACLDTGAFGLGDAEVVAVAPPGRHVWAAIRPDGVVIAAAPEGELTEIRTGSRDDFDPGRRGRVDAGEIVGRLEREIVPGGLALLDARRAVIAEAARIHVFDLELGRIAASFPLPVTPANGILASGRFVYWVDAAGSGLYHLDVETGVIERMYGPLQRGARLAAIATH